MKEYFMAAVKLQKMVRYGHLGGIMLETVYRQCTLNSSAKSLDV